MISYSKLFEGRDGKVVPKVTGNLTFSVHNSFALDSLDRRANTNMSILGDLLIDLKDEFESLSYIATILGIPIALFIFRSEKRKERRAREVEAYTRSTDRYIQYLTLCLDHSDIKAFDPDTIDRGVEARRLIMFSILICVFENAFLSLREASNRVWKRQWQGWENYITMWASEQDFIKTWDLIGGDFDSDFQTYMNQRMTIK
jgi:hypothetical protein